MKLKVLTVVFVSLAVGSPCASAAWGQTNALDGAGHGDTAACGLTDDETRWIQTALDGWERGSRDFLQISPSPLPWMVLLDRSCAWHLAADDVPSTDAKPVRPGLTFVGQPVPVQVLQHDSAIWLPNGSTMPVRGAAFASLYEREPGESAPFFVLALPEIWRETLAEERNLDAVMLGVASHELVHTRQLAHVARRIEELRARYTLPEDIGDDMVEERFEEMPGFRKAHEAETDLLYQAVSEPAPARKRSLVGEALKLIRARQAEYFTGPDAVYRELEGLFLNMEGVAVWAAFRLSQADRARNSWAQDQGLALFLLIDDLVPSWRERVLGPNLASPFQLLEDAIGRQPR